MAKKELTILLFMVLLSNGISIHAQTQTQTKGMSIRKDDSVYRERHYPLGSFLRKTIMKSLPTETQKQLFVAKIAKNFNNQSCWRWTGCIVLKHNCASLFSLNKGAIHIPPVIPSRKFIIEGILLAQFCGFFCHHKVFGFY